MKRVTVNHSVKSGGTRLALYLRGRDSFREWKGGSRPPNYTILVCISAVKDRGAKGASPPNLELFPCLPLPESGESLEDRYVDFILGVSSYVAVSGKPVPLTAFRPPTSEAHGSSVRNMMRQLRDFNGGCGGLDPNEVLGSGRTGRLLADALSSARVPFHSCMGRTGLLEDSEWKTCFLV